MNCKQCGAPMVLYRERDYYHCEHCGSYHFPEENLQGLRVLGENPEGIKCPQCKATLNMATIDDYYRGFQCSNCRGLLFNRTRFREVIDKRRSKIKALAEPITTFNPSELERKTECPICFQEMETFQYLGPGNIVIDTCNTDDLIWLDYGELNKVVSAPGRDRGVPRRKPEKEHQKDKKDESKKDKRSALELFLYKIGEAFFSD
ncbi:MAG: zf-TFIIB domain-containing protein [Anaerolineales bacterium]